MYDVIKLSLKDFRMAYKKYLVFEFLYLLCTSFIFVPIIAYIFNRLLRAMGSSALLNNDIFRIALSVRGLGGLFFIATLAVIVIFVELGSLIVIAHKHFFNTSIMISEAFITIVRKIPSIMGLGLLHLMFLLLFLIPFIDFPLSAILIDNIEIPAFFMEKILADPFFLLFYGSAFLGLVYLYLRWVFVLHFIILEGKKAREAIKESLALTQGNRLRILFKLVSLYFFVFILGMFLISAIAWIPALGNIRFIGYVWENLLITFSSMLAFVWTLLLTPLSIIFITRLYYQAKEKRGLVLADTLVLYNKKFLRDIEAKARLLFGRRRVAVVLLLVINLFGAFVVNYAVTDELLYLGRPVLIAGHRGDLNVAPENTLSSIWSAIEKGVDFVEIDVQATKDGVIVLKHDVSLNRMAGIPLNVRDLTYDEISQIDIGMLFSPEFQGERIPTLAEVLEEVRGVTRLIIEIKPFTPGRELAQKVVELIEAYDMVEDCYVQSFSYEILQEVRRLNKDIFIGQVMFVATGDLSRLDVDFYTIEQRMLTTKLIRRARKDERQIWVWTVNVEEDIKEVLKFDIDGIITDFPERVQSIVGRQPEQRRP